MFIQRTTGKLPDVLIYHIKSHNLYRMIDMKTKSIAGEMIAFPHKRNLFQKELWIDALAMKSDHRNQGFGTKMLDFAQNLSKKLGFKGRLGVKAATIVQTSHIPPHKFYREYGFTSKNKHFIEYIDEHIQNGTKLDYTITPPFEMHFTP